MIRVCDIDCWVVLLNCPILISCGSGRYDLIMVVTIEKGLDTVTAKEDGILTHLLSAVIFPLTVRVFFIKVVRFGRNKGRIYLLIEEIVPRIIFEPDMFFDFLWTIQT
jgi:hypothetical protein